MSGGKAKLAAVPAAKLPRLRELAAAANREHRLVGEVPWELAPVDGELRITSRA